MVAFSGPLVSGQAKIDPDHFESPNAEPFENAKTHASGKVAPVDYGHKVDAPYALLMPAGLPPENQESEKPRYLFICAGDQAHTNPDFLAVVNFDERSLDYGKVIAIAPLPEPGATGNEFHHIGLSADGRVVACGGLLSVLKGQKEIFFWDVSDPESPRFISAADPPLSAITDDFHALPQGGFFVTMMGGAQGHAPGRVAEFDRRLNLVREHPENPPEDGFNPHGISVRPEINLMVTSDFVCPSTTLDAVPGSVHFRGSVRVWNLRRRQILRTINIPGAGGTIDVKPIPRDTDVRALRGEVVAAEALVKP